MPPSESAGLEVFARECQLVAGVLALSPPPTEVLRALQSILRAVPDTLTPATVPPVTRILSDLTKHVQREVQRPLRDGSRRVEYVAVHILRSYADNTLTLKGIARQFGTTSDHLSLLLRSATGAHFLDHLHAVRVVHLVSLLPTADSSIGALAVRVGYRQASHLVRRFKAALHLTPHRFRKLCRDARTTAESALSR